MRTVSVVFILAGLMVMAGLVIRGCDRSLSFSTTYNNTVSTTTPGATVSLEKHAGLAWQAMNDVESLVVWAVVGGGLLLAGAVVAILVGSGRDDRRHSLPRGENR